MTGSARQSHLFDEQEEGAVITEIAPLPRDPNLRRIRVGRRTMATIVDADVQRLRLRTGMRWTASLAAKVGEAAEAQRARKAALNLLGRRALSSAELGERLLRKGFAEKVIDRVRNELISQGWLDDRAYGEAIVRETVRRKPASARLLKARLKAKGIGASLARDLTEQPPDGPSDEDQALKLAKERLSEITDLPRVARVRRVCGLLARRGYDPVTIETVLGRLGINSNDADA